MEEQPRYTQITREEFNSLHNKGRFVVGPHEDTHKIWGMLASGEFVASHPEIKQDDPNVRVCP